MQTVSGVDFSAASSDAMTVAAASARRNAHRLVSGAMIVVCAVSALSPGAAASPAPLNDSLSAFAPRIEWGLTYASKYLFHGGFDYSEGKPVLQSQATAGWNGLSFQVWSNCDQARREVNELDATMQYDWQRGPVSGAAAVAHLRYPNRDWEPTQELIGSLAFATLLEPTLDLHWDVAEGDGGYWTVGLSRELSISQAALTVTSSLYGLQHYYGQSGITALETAVSVRAEWAGFFLEPSLQRQWTWGNRDLVGENRIDAGWLLALTVASR